MDMLTWENIQSVEWLQVLTKTGVIVSVVVGAILLVLLARKIYGLVYQLRRRTVLLEITPPAFNDKAIAATDSFFTALYGLDIARTFSDRLLGRKPVFEARLSSTRAGGIRFFLRTPEEHAEVVTGLLFSYLPDVKVTESKDSEAFHTLPKGRILEFKQTHPYALPLKHYGSLGSHDPVGYLANAMTKLKDGEQVVFQIVFVPERVRKAKRLRKQILKNEGVLTSLIEGKQIGGPVLSALSSLSLGIIDIVSTIQDHGQSRRYATYSKTREYEHKRQVARGEYPARMISPFERDDVEPIHQKLSNPLFRTSIRAYIYSDSKAMIKKKRAAISSSVGLFKTKYQSLWLRRRKFLLSKRLLALLLSKGLPDVFYRPMYLSSSELAGLYHFPHSVSAKAENVVKSLSKTLQAPLNLKDGTKLDVLIGENRHQGTTTPVGLTANERQRHMFIIGGTGNGKTTMIKYQAVQDILAGKGVAVIDPHGDLAEEILRYIPEERIKDVVYFNPSDIAHPIGLNLLEVSGELEGDELQSARDFVTEAIVSIFRKTFSDDATGGHRIEHNLRNAALTAMTVKDATLFTILDLLTDKEYRKPIVEKLEQEWLKKFWENEYGKGSAWQQVKAMGGVTAKISRYHASVSADRILSQPKSTINFDEILDGKILICNLAKGLIGEDTSEVFGISILAQLQLAAYRRIKQKESERKPFHVYVDEFQNFATISFTEMLSESRKYKLYLTMAEQSTQQQDDQKLVHIIMNNIGTLVSFRTGSVADERIIRPALGERYIDQGELPNLPAYNFYARIVGEETNEPMSGVTVVLKDKGSAEIAEKVTANSRAIYATKYVPPKPRPEIKEKTEQKKPNSQNKSLKGKKSQSKGSRQVPKRHKRRNHKRH